MAGASAVVKIEAKRLDRAPATTMCLACAKEG
jgi:hypothetical protein